MANTDLVNIFSPRFEYIKGKEAWRENLRLTAFAADRIRSSLGPNGAYKMVSYNRGPEKIVKITRDAAAVVEELATQYPTLVVLSEAAKLQRQEIGDGVKSFIILTAELLKKANELVSKGVHPTRIIKGYSKATLKALEIISSISKPLHESEINSVLDSVDCGRGCITRNIREMLGQAESIATRDGQLDKDLIRIVRKPGGNQSETILFKGLVIKKSKLHPNMLESIEKAKIALTNGRIGINRTEVKMPGQGPFSMNLNVTVPKNLVEFKNSEKQKKHETFASLKEKGVNVLFSQQPIDDYSKSKLLKMGTLAFASVDPTDLALISKATKARIVTNIVELEKTDVGFADRIVMDRIGLEDVCILQGGPFATFLIRGSSLQALDELELSIQNAMQLLQVAKASPNVVAGSGAAEVRVSKVLKDFALQFPGREQLAINEFSEALLEIPRALAANNGVFAEETLTNLGEMHHQGLIDYGIAEDGECAMACKEVSGVINSVVRRAFEVASLLLRIDEQIVAKEIPKFHK